MISKNQIKLVRSLEQKKYRQREGLFVAEGPKVVGDLLAAGFVARMLFATDDWTPPTHAPHRDSKEFSLSNSAPRREFSLSNSAPIQTITDDELRKLSFLQHPQQVLGVFNLPSPLTPHPSPFALALDGVQDPGNLGTIIRLADWFAIDTIFCSEDTADAWSPKVVQATMGSIARVTIVYTDLEALLSKTYLPVYGTLLDGDDIYQQELSPEGIIVMGNEGNGISAPIRSLITRKLLIPKFHEGPESLNVAIATAIVCSEFRRRKSPNGSDSQSEPFGLAVRAVRTHSPNRSDFLEL